MRNAKNLAAEPETIPLSKSASDCQSLVAKLDRPTAAANTADDEELSISQAAGLFEVSLRTLRFYEEKGLVAPRRIGNRRYYGQFCQNRLRLVLKGKAMGMGLESIGELVALVESPALDTQRARQLNALCSEHLAELEKRRQEVEEQLGETQSALDGLSRL
jgi:DNA-binding transcriptional MerR regulator